MISFQSLQEYHDFGASVDLPDDEFSEFIHSHGFYMSGVDSKEDAERIISLLDNVALPDFSGYKYYMSSLRFDNNAFTIWYSRADEDICCMSVTIIVTESLPAEELKKYENSSVYSLISLLIRRKRMNTTLATTLPVMLQTSIPMRCLSI